MTSPGSKMLLCDRGGKGSPDLRCIAATFRTGKQSGYRLRPIAAPSMTKIDNSLTRPWSTTKSYRRSTRNVAWAEDSCSEGNPHVVIGKEVYFRGPDGMLMPVKKNQPPPDLKYFNQTRK
jgi:hypothetical protein